MSCSSFVKIPIKWRNLVTSALRTDLLIDVASCNFLHVLLFINNAWSRALFSLFRFSCETWSLILREEHKMRGDGRDSSVGIATRYGLDGPGTESWVGARFFAPVQNGTASHPASYTMGTGSLSRGGVKRSVRGFNHLPPPHLAPRLKKE